MENKRSGLRTLVILIFVGIVIYTFFAIQKDGINFFPIYFKDIALVGWSGQFNIDFGCYLLLSSLWIGWRHKFDTKGIILGLFGIVGGMLYFAPYLIWATTNAKGDIKRLLLGDRY